MMKNFVCITDNENGSVIVIVMLILVVLTLTGLFAMMSSNTEMQISSNDLRHKIAFYTADGATEIASEMLEQNLSCPVGFTPDEVGGTEATVGNVVVTDLTFYKNTAVSDASDSNRDMYFPAAYGTGPHTNMKVGGDTHKSTGSALQIAAGYEGTGEAMAGGGSYILYDIRSQHLGSLNSEALINIQWRHMIGNEGDCIH